MPPTAANLQEQTAQQASGLLNRFIADKRLRRTPERELVLQAIMALKGRRFTIKELEADINADKPVLSRGTIVNSLKLMQQAGLVLKVGTQRRHTLYQASPQPRQRSKAARIPFVIALSCMACGNIKNVRDREATAALASRRYGAFMPLTGVITIHGLCADCKVQESDNKQNKTKQ